MGLFALTLKHAYLFASLVHTLHSWPNNGMKKKKNLRSLAAVKTRIHPTTAYQHPPTFKLFNFQGLRHWQTVRLATEVKELGNRLEHLGLLRYLTILGFTKSYLRTGEREILVVLAALSR